MQLLDIEKFDNLKSAMEEMMLGLILGFVLQVYIENPKRKRNLFIGCGILVVAISSLVNPFAIFTAPLGMLIGYSIARLYNWVAFKWFY